MLESNTYIIDIISDSNIEVCSICLEPFNDESSYIEHDKHYFHIICIQNYVKISKKSMPLICPVCNNEESTISKEIIFPDGIIDDNINNNCNYCNLCLAFFTANRNSNAILLIIFIFKEIIYTKI